MTSSTEAPPESAQEAAATASEGHPASKAGHRARRRLLSRVSAQSKLIVMLLISSILSASVVGFIGYESGRSSPRASVRGSTTIDDRRANVKRALAVVGE
jgi:hypothetical protein